MEQMSDRRDRTHQVIHALGIPGGDARIHQGAVQGQEQSRVGADVVTVALGNPLGQLVPVAGRRLRARAIGPELGDHLGAIVERRTDLQDLGELTHPGLVGTAGVTQRVGIGRIDAVARRRGRQQRCGRSDRERAHRAPVRREEALIDVGLGPRRVDDRLTCGVAHRAGRHPQRLPVIGVELGTAGRVGRRGIRAVDGRVRHGKRCVRAVRKVLASVATVVGARRDDVARHKIAEAGRGRGVEAGMRRIKTQRPHLRLEARSLARIGMEQKLEHCMADGDATVRLAALRCRSTQEPIGLGRGQGTLIVGSPGVIGGGRAHEQHARDYRRSRRIAAHGFKQGLVPIANDTGLHAGCGGGDGCGQGEYGQAATHGIPLVVGCDSLICKKRENYGRVVTPSKSGSTQHDVCALDHRRTPPPTDRATLGKARRGEAMPRQ